MFFDAFWSRPPRILNNHKDWFSLRKTILLKFSLRAYEGTKIKNLKENKAFLKIDWKRHANIFE